MSIIEDIKARIAEISENEWVSAASDIKTGSARSADNLPMVMIMTDAGVPREESETGSETMYLDRTFDIFLLVQPWVEGDELEAEEAVSPYVDLFYTTFKGRQALEYPRNQNALDYVIFSKPTGDTGVINIRMQGIDYAGCQFTLQVTYVQLIDFA